VWLCALASGILESVRFWGRNLAVAGVGILCVLDLPGDALARTCVLSMHLEAPVELGALQLELDYSDAAGTFAMTGDDLDCDGDVKNTLVEFGHYADSSHVTVSLLSLVGFDGPRKLAHCRFIDPNGETSNADFGLYVSDASDLDGNGMGSPRVSLTFEACDDLTTTTSSSSTTTSTTTASTTSTTYELCGDGVADGLEECDDGNTDDGDGCHADCTAGEICGDANGNDEVQSSDALLVLRAAIGQPIPCPAHICDTDGDEVLRAGDSLRVLRRAVGQSVPMTCPLA
jgi:cysteine-rich repeat protein